MTERLLDSQEACGLELVMKVVIMNENVCGFP
jgi:hypothetical protein